MSRKEYNAPMHTAEHILNATMDRMFGCGRSFNAHIERKKSKCDYRLPRPLVPAELEAIEAAVNRVIADDLPVAERRVSRAEAEARYFTGKLPAAAGDSIRIVSVGDYDHCPCIGRHVGRTGELGAFRIVSADHADGVLRLRFVVTTTEDSTRLEDHAPAREGGI
jgi:alanyl-tRNA synthetase